MTAFRFRVAIAAMTVACLPLMQLSAADAPKSALDPVVQAYLRDQQSAQEKTRDQNVANHATALSQDPGSPVVGNPQGDVAVIEFFDYTCPYCKAVEPRLEKLIKDDKKVKVVYKEFPILTPESLVATRVALAAAKQGKYQQFHDAMINFRGRLQNDAIFDTAKSVGLNMERLRKDMDAPDVTDQIIANFNLARALRVFQTPTLIIGNHLLTEASADIDFPKTVAAARTK